MTCGPAYAALLRASSSVSQERIWFVRGRILQPSTAAQGPRQDLVGQGREGLPLGLGNSLELRLLGMGNEGHEAAGTDPVGRRRRTPPPAVTCRGDLAFAHLEQETHAPGGGPKWDGSMCSGRDSCSEPTCYSGLDHIKNADGFAGNVRSTPGRRSDRVDSRSVPRFRAVPCGDPGVGHRLPPAGPGPSRRRAPAGGRRARRPDAGAVQPAL